jgi:peptide/nickel transport system permease protein
MNHLPAALAARVGHALLVLLGVALLVFALLHLTPGDPVEALLGESAASADREALRHALGLDAPLTTQLARYLGGLAHGDLGISLYSQQAVADMIAERLPATLGLACAALLIALVIAAPLGMAAAAQPNSHWDRATLALVLAGGALPGFVLGPLLMLIFALQLGWFPISGADEPGAWVLPAVTLALGMAALLARMLRASLLETLHEDYIKTARAKGLAPHTVLLRHALRNALLPVITLLALQLGTLLAGAVIVETLFSWPGLGQLTVEAIQRRDYPVVQGCVLVISTGYVLVNLLAEWAYAWADPRLRHM